MDTTGQFDVSVVLAVYNERGHVRQEIERIRASLEASSYTFEIIVVDDGSNDGSADELGQIQDIRLIRFTRNRGTGAARKAGTRAARGRAVAWTDADMTYPNQEIPRLVKELDGYDQVVGARTSEQGRIKALRVPAKWFIRKLASYLIQQPIPDLNSGLRVFRRDVALQYLHMLPEGFSCVSTLSLAFLANGYSIGYVPIEYRQRAGRSKFHWWTDTKRYVTQVVRMILSWNPLRVFIPVGVVLSLIAITKLGYDWATKDFHVAANTLLVFFAAFQIFAIGLLADLVVRVTKPRDEVEPSAQFTRDSAEPRPD
ncbi:MAG TPA: glycosyltransferase family 2 protein [Actinomycetota bacterium]|nr:glycosyltransferase family 2 protein [Actinomycetota bacterium]